jgi:uncharacterized protein with FMN-binding domain
MKRLIASVIVVLAFTFYAIFSRNATEQTVASADGSGSAAASGSTAALPLADGDSDDPSAQLQSAVTAAPQGYADGTYTGSRVNALYGVVQVRAIIKGGRIAEVQFLSHPTGRHSDELNAQAAPILVQEAISTQSARVQVVSGATLTSNAFMESLQTALDQA